MDNYDIYRDIAARTDGDIYIGVVGPVRTGKSTFIQSFMETAVLPNIEDSYAYRRSRDELPQAGEGTSVMTTEPKFVPNEAVGLNMGNVHMNVRLIDCVGYVVDGVSGFDSDNMPRMVKTPWAEEKMPFAQAAELGTRKVMCDHATIGVVVTSDGSVSGLPRESYIAAEQRVIEEMKETGKPFVIVLNTGEPEKGRALAEKKQQEYERPVIAVDCKKLGMEEINHIMEAELYQFPVAQVDINMPKWVETLPSEHWLRKSLIESVKELKNDLKGLDSLDKYSADLEQNENIKKCYTEEVDTATGKAKIEIALNNELFYNILSETTGMDIDGEYSLIATIKQLAQANNEYNKIKFALDEVKRKGYGIVTPPAEDMELDKPTLMKQGNRYGISVGATAPSIHMIRADIKTSVSPIVGNEEQSKELVGYLNSQYSLAKDNIWEYNIFGRTLKELIAEDLNNKMTRIPEETQGKFRDTIEKIINEGHGGLICILL